MVRCTFIISTLLFASPFVTAQFGSIAGKLTSDAGAAASSAVASATSEAASAATSATGGIASAAVSMATSAGASVVKSIGESVVESAASSLLNNATATGGVDAGNITQTAGSPAPTKSNTALSLHSDAGLFTVLIGVLVGSWAI